MIRDVELAVFTSHLSSAVEQSQSVAIAQDAEHACGDIIPRCISGANYLRDCALHKPDNTSASWASCKDSRRLAGGK